MNDKQFARFMHTLDGILLPLRMQNAIAVIQLRQEKPANLGRTLEEMYELELFARERLGR